MTTVRMLLPALCLTAAGSFAWADGVLEGHARRGAVYERITMDGGTERACAALCDCDAMCRSWVLTRPGLQGPDSQCALLSATPTPYAAPGQTTGLSARIAAAIEAASDRPPDAREIPALAAAAGERGE